MTTIDSLRKRWAAVVRRRRARGLRGDTGAAMRVTIEGGLPCEPWWAYAGELRLYRDGAETFEEFAARCLDAAREAGERLLVVGGLPRYGEVHEMFDGFEAFWDAKCAPTYPDVPEISKR